MGGSHQPYLDYPPAYPLFGVRGLVLTVGPALGLGLYNGFVDSYPVWLCLGLGALVSILAASSRRVRPGDEYRQIIESAAQRSRALKQAKRERRLAATRPKTRNKKGARRDASIAVEPTAGNGSHPSARESDGRLEGTRGDGVNIYGQTIKTDTIREVRILFYGRHHDRRVK